MSEPLGELKLGTPVPAFGGRLDKNHPLARETIMLCEMAYLDHLSEAQTRLLEDNHTEIPLLLVSSAVLRKLMADVDDITNDYLLEPQSEKMDQTLGSLARRKAACEFILKLRKEQR